MITFDAWLERLSQRYRGEGRLQRLIYIGTAEDESFKRAAYTAALLQLQQQGNASRFSDLIRKLEQFGNNRNATTSSSSTTTTTTTAANSMLLLDASSISTDWIPLQEEENRHARNVLTGRLQAAQARLNKDSIRTAYLALAEYELRSGDLTDAFHAALRSKDYCTNRQQTVEVSLKILEFSIYLKNYAFVRDYVNKLTHAVGGMSDPVTPGENAGTLCKILTASGLDRLAANDYGKAAANFRSVAFASSFAIEPMTRKHPHEQPHQQQQAGTEGPGSGTGGAGGGDVSMAIVDWWQTVLAPEEVALYAAFLTLVTGDRRAMVDLAEHPDALELVPAAREALLLFGNRANYLECWKLLESDVYPMLRADVYMGPHMEDLVKSMREKSILQYWKAYERVELPVMTTYLGSGILPSGEEQLTEILIDLIGKGIAPDTRIDMQSRILLREEEPEEDKRLRETSLKMSTFSAKVLNDTYSMITRLACLENDMIVIDPMATKGRVAATRASRMVDVGRFDDSSSDDDDTPMVDINDGMNPEDLY